MAKREKQIDEFKTLGNISNASPNAKLHGVIFSISPMKKSKTCSYFDGQDTDGESSMSVFGFDAGVRKKLAFYEKSKQAVTITNCEIKTIRKGKDLEVLVTKNTEVSKSDKIFDIKTSCSKGGVIIELNELQDMDKYKYVNVNAKALRLEDVEEVPGGKKFQNIVIADKNATARLSIWEGEIGKIEAGKSYQLIGLVVREFRGRKFLCTSKDKTTILASDDVTEVVEETANDSTTNTTTPSYSWVRECTVIGVMTLDKYQCCINCNTKIAQDYEDPDLGHCSKCQMTQCLEGASKGLMAKIMVASGGTKYSLCAFGKVVENITNASSDQISTSMLLKAEPFKMIQVDGIIQNVLQN